MILSKSILLKIGELKFANYFQETKMKNVSQATPQFKNIRAVLFKLTTAINNISAKIKIWNIYWFTDEYNGHAYTKL
jgi:hypothetical protein